VKEKRKYLYVLLLEGGNYYIGQTNDLVRRFRQHSEQIGEGSIWTFYHKPIKLVEYWDLGEYTQEGAMQFENILTLEYINKYGYEKVRGGDFVFTDTELHLKSIKNKNYIIEGKIIPKITDQTKLTFAKIKTQIETLSLTSQSYIYVLELENECIYINRSSDLINDLHKHFFKKGSLWSSINRPINLLEIIDDKDLGKNHGIPFQNSIVKKYMETWGWQNVRGGDYKIIDINEHHRLLNKKMPEVLK
jgi:predicted GIY-YIG superfamily endonuclease